MEDSDSGSIDIDSAVPIYKLRELQKGKIKRVIDGDTVIVVGRIKSVNIEYKIRVLGIDTPEKGKQKTISEKERTAGLAVKQYVEDLLPPGKKIKFYIHAFDKFGGRYDGDIYFDEQKLSQHLLDRRFCKAYKGEKKSVWTDEQLDSILDNVV